MSIRTLAAIGLALSMGALSDGSLAGPPPQPQLSTSVRNVATEPLRDSQAQAQAEAAAQAQAKGKTAAPGGLQTQSGTATQIREIPRLDRPVLHRKTKPGEDTAVQSSPTAGKSGPIGVPAMPSAERSFEGQHNIYGVLPPDSVGDVGPNH